MKKTLIMKAAVLGTIACCSFSGPGIAANIQDTNEIGVGRTAVDEAKREAVHSTWMDRTDVVIGIGIGQKSTEKSASYRWPVFTYVPSSTVTSDKSKSTELNKFYIETLQPLTHYDENSKSVAFVQGRIGRSGEKISSSKLSNYWIPAMPAGTFTIHERQRNKEESLGVTANVGVGYRRLSKHEHSYVGANAFYDHAFKNGYKRISGGIEYVAGYNEVYANIYRNLGTHNRKYIGLYGRSIILGDPTGLYPYGRDSDASLYNYGKVVYENHWKLVENVAASGFDIGYARTFKNARWARVYADYYNWRGRSAVRVGYRKLDRREAVRGMKFGAELHITPHLTLNAGYQTNSLHLNGPYATLTYTIGASKFAWFGGKHSDNVITTARSKMLDRVHRSDMVVHDIVLEDYDHGVVDVGL